MRTLFSLLLMGVSFLSPAQNNPSPEDLIKCRGLPQVQLKAKFFIKGVEQKEYIKKSDLQNDGYLFLSDTTYLDAALLRPFQQLLRQIIEVFFSSVYSILWWSVMVKTLAIHSHEENKGKVIKKTGPERKFTLYPATAAYFCHLAGSGFRYRDLLTQNSHMIVTDTPWFRVQYIILIFGD